MHLTKGELSASIVLLFKKVFLISEKAGAKMAGSSVLEKGLGLLSHFTEDRTVLSISDLSALAHLSTSTVYRYLVTLRSQGFIEVDARPGYYRLGLKILDLSRAIKRRTTISLSLPVMEDLANQTGESILLCARYGQKGTCLEKVEGRHNLRVSYARGEPFHLHAGATGKVLLACLSNKEVAAIIRDVGLPAFTKNTITDLEKLKTDLAKIRKAGFAVSNGEMHEGVRAIAAPIYNGRRKVIADLTVGAPVHRLEGLRIEETVRMVIEAARKITEQMSVYED